MKTLPDTPGCNKYPIEFLLAEVEETLLKDYSRLSQPFYPQGTHENILRWQYASVISEL